MKEQAMRNGLTGTLLVMSGCLYTPPVWTPPPPPPDLIECNSFGSCTAILHVDQDWLEICWDSVPENQRPPEVNACINQGLCDIPAGSFDFDMRGASTCVTHCSEGVGNGYCNPASHLSDSLSDARTAMKSELTSACPGVVVPMTPDEECSSSSSPPFDCTAPTNPPCLVGEKTEPDDTDWMDASGSAAMIAVNNPALRFEGVLTSGSSVTLTRSSAPNLTSSITGGVQLIEGSNQLANVVLQLSDVVDGSTTWTSLTLHGRGSFSVNPATTPATITFDPSVTGGFIHLHGFENGVERLFSVSGSSPVTGTLDLSTNTWTMSTTQTTSLGEVSATLVGNVQDLP